MRLSAALFFSERHNCDGALKLFKLFFFLVGAQLDKIGFTIIKKCISAIETRGNDQPNVFVEGAEQLACLLKEARVI